MKQFFEQHRYNVGPGPHHLPAEALDRAPPSDPGVRLIAYYLPQFHPVPENSEWWGPGFTEWTNVTKALPRFLGHRQPNLPADLGFYDLRSPDVLRAQADLAKRAGIFGFCIHNYWFGGRRILEKPLQLLLEHPDIDLRFCLNWANENWTRKWDGGEANILLQQDHSPEDDVAYVESLLPALRDPRYIRVDGRPLIMLYRPSLLPDARETVRRWRDCLAAHGVGNPYVVMAQWTNESDPRPYGMDAAAAFPPHNGGWGLPNRRSSLSAFDPSFNGTVLSYDGLRDAMLDAHTTQFRMFPGVCPRWDNEARKSNAGTSFHGAGPAAYGGWLERAVEQAMAAANPDERIVFVNAWNEWAEGAFLEPDRHYGHAFLVETRRVVEAAGNGGAGRQVRSAPDAGSPFEAAEPSRWHRVRNGARSALGRLAPRAGRP